MNKIETHDTMNPEQQDIAIFESLGWKYLPPVKRGSSFIVRPENLPRWKKGREIAYKGDIPSYGTDLNAMQSAVASQNVSFQLAFHNALLSLPEFPHQATSMQWAEIFVDVALRKGIIKP